MDHGSVVLAAFSDKAHTYAADKLQHNGVHLKLGTGVTEIAADKVKLSDGTEILTRAVVWAGGIQAPELAGKLGLEQGRGGRVTSQSDLTVEGLPHVYAIGDMANMPDHDGNDFPQLGSVALQAGRWAAKNIVADIDGKPRQPFHYKDKGIMAMIGSGVGGRRDGRASPRAPRSCRVRCVARRPRLADERRARARRRLLVLGMGLPRIEPIRRAGRRTRRRPDRLGRRNR